MQTIHLSRRRYQIFLSKFSAWWLACAACLMLGVAISRAAESDETLFPDELVCFVPAPKEPVFTGAGPGHWDVRIRERGWILREGGTYRMWYTGYDGTREGRKKLGYATSPDGIHWQRAEVNPLYAEHWVEDMMIVPHEDTYYMFAEGERDQAHLLTSSDGIQWTRIGPLDIRNPDGSPLSPGPFGTPTAFWHDGKWYLFFERYDQGIWLATSEDLAQWTLVQKDPVLSLGPANYDGLMIALNQIVPYNGRFYAYYHGSGDAEKPRRWAPAVAVSEDLIHWQKYSGNPLRPVEENKSSGIVVADGEGSFRFYTMHDRVHVHVPSQHE